MLTLSNFWTYRNIRRNAVVIAALILSLTSWPAVFASNSDIEARLGYLPLRYQELNLLSVKPLDDLNLSSLSALVLDVKTMRVVGAQDPDLELPLASLTKMMTAVVVMDRKLNLDQVVAIQAADNSELTQPFAAVGDRISNINVKDGENITARNLLGSSLVGSANNATAALARAAGVSSEIFVSQMNEQAEAYGMRDSKFTDTTGLDPHNASTALDVALLYHYAWNKPLLKKFSGAKEFKFNTLQGKAHTIRNTNTLVRRPQGFIPVASKTGYLDEANHNLVFQFITPKGGEYLLILLNEPTLKTRDEDVFKIIRWLEKK